MKSLANELKTIVSNEDGIFVDSNGDNWFVFSDDMKGNYAVNREDGCAAAVVCGEHLYARRDGDTFDCNNPDEFIVRNDQWEPNTL